MVLQSFTSFFYIIIIPSSSEEERERGGEKKITHGKMQMSLEAITMLMRFHHRSCCSGIRGIFHPYLENNCALKIGNTLGSVHTGVGFSVRQSRGHTGSDRSRLAAAAPSSKVRHIVLHKTVKSALFLELCLSHCCMSITSKIPLINITIKLFLLGSDTSQTSCMLAHVPSETTQTNKPSGGKKRQMRVVVNSSSRSFSNTATSLDFHARL